MDAKLPVADIEADPTHILYDWLATQARTRAIIRWIFFIKEIITMYDTPD